MAEFCTIIHMNEKIEATYLGIWDRSLFAAPSFKVYKGNGMFFVVDSKKFYATGNYLVEAGCNYDNSDKTNYMGFKVKNR